ncbi:CsgG/HfaB family protein [Gilvimarinus xylanilyticus]|uniref:Curli production assembly/transport component CsgG n=1 Tax=Gilvimarinus xylanilyticus TaxID=2944139 RepID=A0A9X2HXV6_9GAMM|nr:CsgG/HfaB family protein [Gilvimarinus xylanilyticus]MCP8900393.1 hypothetical protein [Gilvimarinus xylanilyticus]
MHHNIWKKLGFILLALVLVPASWAAPRIAVVDFENKSQHGGWELGRGAADMLTTSLVKGTEFDIYERDQLNAVLDEQDLGQSGRMDVSTAAQIGKLIGVEYIVTGAVTEYGDSRSGGGGGGVHVGKKGYYATVDIRLVDVNTARIVFADSGSGDKASMNVRVFGFGGGEGWNEKHATEAMRGAIEELTRKLANADLEGGGIGGAANAQPVLLADVAGNDIILNAGSGAGLVSGDTLTVKRKGREIKDPATGAVLKVTYDTLGTIELTNVEAAYAEAKVVSGSGFKVGDMAE